MNKIKDKYKQHYIDNKIELIYRSSIFEGLATTRMETRQIIYGGKGIGAKYEDTQVIINIYNTWQWVMREEFRGSEREVLIELNNRLKNGQEDSNLTGKIRTHNVTISGTTYKPPSYRKYNLSEMLDRLLRNLRLKENSMDALLYVYIHLMRTQFFVDGNKRTAYLFTNWVLMVNDMGHILYLPSETSRDEYLTRLKGFYEDPRVNEMEMIKYIKRYYLRKV